MNVELFHMQLAKQSISPPSLIWHQPKDIENNPVLYETNLKSIVLPFLYQTNQNKYSYYISYPSLVYYAASINSSVRREPELSQHKTNNRNGF